MCAPDPPEPPDYSELAEASEANFELAHELAQQQFAWAQDVYEDNQELVDQVAEFLIPAMEENTQNALGDREFYEEVFRPLEEQLAADAASYATQARKDKEIGAAQADVAQNFNAARQNAQRQLESFGINPSATRYAALDLGVRADQAAAQAAAGTQAADRVDAIGRALRSEAINIGRGYPGQIAGTYATGIGAGQGAVQNDLALTQSGGATMGTAPAYLSGGNQALGTWGNILHMGYQDQLSAWQAGQQSSGFGSALGALAGMGMAFLDDGGVVPEELSPSRGAIPDDVNAGLTAGEFVIPDDVVRWKGEEFFHKQIEQSRTKRGEIVEAIPTIKPANPNRPAQRGALPARVTR